MNWNLRYANELAGYIINIQPPPTLNLKDPESFKTPESQEYFETIRKHLIEHDKVPAHVLDSVVGEGREFFLQSVFDQLHNTEDEYYTSPAESARINGWETPTRHRVVRQRWTIDTSNHPSRGGPQ